MPNPVDLARLRSGRLARLQAAMRARHVEACLLFNEPNIRYATGASAMPIWSNTTFVRCALVPAEGRPILYEHPNSRHLFRGLEADVRPMHAWEFYDDTATHATIFARETVAALRERGVGSPRLAVDRLGTPGYVALQREGIVLEDSATVTTAAREIKTPEEIALFELNGAILMEMLAGFERALAPGVRERDLLAGLADTLLRRGGEHLATSTVCSGPNTNPWRAEATARLLEPGDLVYVDTDAVGVEGYFFCVSRTFLCGDRPPTPAQREVYRVAHDWLRALREMIRPGLTCGELAARAPRLPRKFMPQRYEVMIHGIGLEEESPSVAYPEDPQPNGDRVLRENMVLVAELYCGEVGGRDGVKLGDQLVVTPQGVKVLVPYSYCDALLE
ncbi:MAG TPA: Xaa-Pro peptidase family protein [Candidatus Polarisedimenticolia bacterium]|nr:Xaa-Pro peptidase family protein [Candidatus Polarisedimenticolia bacterium]